MSSSSVATLKVAVAWLAGMGTVLVPKSPGAT